MADGTLPDRSVTPVDRAAWRQWLAQNHDRASGVWLVFTKKGFHGPRVAYEDAVQEALCFGWVDSRPGTVDGTRSRLYFSPRQPGSGWAATNKARVERLIAAGQMTPAGQAKIDAAIADGSWTLLDAVEVLTVPEDLAQALAALPGARAHFDAFSRSARRGLLEWIVQAKRPETRAQRIDQTARCAAENRVANAWRPKANP